MGFLDFLKRKKDEADAVNSRMITLGRCSGKCAGCSCAAPKDAIPAATQSVRVLGPEGEASRMLVEHARKAVALMGLPVSVDIVTDMNDIAAYGVMPLPALVVDETVVATGRELSPEEIGAYLTA